jgi:hypothetical protein
MKPPQARIADLWCKLMHTEPMWPSHVRVPEVRAAVSGGLGRAFSGAARAGNAARNTGSNNFDNCSRIEDPMLIVVAVDGRILAPLFRSISCMTGGNNCITLQ